jgi:coenzyme F420-reducing hydrogenase delta subunit
MVSYDVREIRNTLPTLVGKVYPSRQEPTIVAFTCANHAGILGLDLPKNVKSIPVHCTSRVDVLDMLKAFEVGADGVAVVRCGDGNCKYKDIAPRVNARVKRVQDLLGMLKIETGRVEILSAASTNGGNPYSAVCKEFSERVKTIGMRSGK